MRNAVGTAACCVASCLLGCGSHEQQPRPTPRPPPVTASVAAPDAPLVVSFPTPWAVGDRPQGKRVVPADNYHLVFAGPGGAGCDERADYELGYAALPVRSPRRTVELRPIRDPTFRHRRFKTWCPGRYAGRVEFRQPDRVPRLRFPTLGRFSFAVPG